MKAWKTSRNTLPNWIVLQSGVWGYADCVCKCWHNGDVRLKAFPYS